jgi:4-amino-4-deoxy-L-arabinose transferase-like glycosyltransferase
MTVTDPFAPGSESEYDVLTPQNPQPFREDTVSLDAEEPARPEPRRGRVERVWRGPETDPAWVRPALFALLLGTGVLYLWGLGASGWANTYYAAAVQAGAKSWKALFFGSTDASNFITVDKTPASLWPMEISARIFGVNSWSVLVPQALMGVAAVGLLFATVKRWFSPGAAFTAGVVVALTPVAALMFRFNNPDALLTLLLVGSAYCMTRALEDGRLRWLIGAGVCVGFAFLAKELQAFLVLPGYGLVYLAVGKPQLVKRLGHVLALGLATLAAGGWWVLIVSLWPASSRPYIGGSTNNSFFNVLFGYNGFGRLTGNEAGSVGGGAAGTTGRWGPTGWTRMFNDQFGGQISWLLPAALLLLVAGLVYTARRSRTDRTRAALLLWGSWLFFTGVAFSLGQGIIHEYYTGALAPAIGALVGIGGALFWAQRSTLFARSVLAVTLGASALWGAALLHRTPNWHPTLRTVVLFGGLALALFLAVAPALRGRAGAAIAIAAVTLGLLAPAAYTWETVTTPQSGAIPTAGPANATRGPGGGFPGGARGGAPGGFTQRPQRGFGGFPGRGFATPPNFGNGSFTPTPGMTPNANGARAGGLLEGSEPGAELTALLEASGDYRWAAAAVGANAAGGYQLASGEPVMAIGGFNGTDPAPTLAQFQEYVANGDIHYFIGGGGFGRDGGGTNTSAEIAQWVQQNFTAQTVDGVTIYDLTS